LEKRWRKFTNTRLALSLSGRQKVLTLNSLIGTWRPHLGTKERFFVTVDDQYDYWKGLFKSVVDQHAPTKKKRVRENDISYMTPEWKQAIRNKRQFAVHALQRTAPLKTSSSNGNIGILQHGNIERQ